MSRASMGTLTLPGAARPRWRRWLENAITDASLWRGIVAIGVFLLLWELGSRSSDWFGVRMPFVGLVPAPTDVALAWADVLTRAGYWESCWLSFARVLQGFTAAVLLGVPLGLAMAVNRTFRLVLFAPFEVLRPIPPLAWVPASLIFWPTSEMSIIFVTFLGAFFTIVINVIEGARSIDGRFIRAARSMGATQVDLFWRVILPATLPSIFTGASVGMGITWEVVLAAEMISGGGTQAGGGLGFFIWNSYLGGSLKQIVVGMISIGIAGFLSAAAIRTLGRLAMPWLRTR